MIASNFLHTFILVQVEEPCSDSTTYKVRRILRSVWFRENRTRTAQHSVSASSISDRCPSQREKMSRRSGPRSRIQPSSGRWVWTETGRVSTFSSSEATCGCFSLSGSRVQTVPPHQTHQRRVGVLQERTLLPPGGNLTSRGSRLPPALQDACRDLIICWSRCHCCSPARTGNQIITTHVRILRHFLSPPTLRHFNYLNDMASSQLANLSVKKEPRLPRSKSEKFEAEIEDVKECITLQKEMESSSVSSQGTLTLRDKLLPDPNPGLVGLLLILTFTNQYLNLMWSDGVLGAGPQWPWLMLKSDWPTEMPLICHSSLLHH